MGCRMKRVFIIHGWDGKPEHGWYLWLKKQLEAKEFQAEVPEMPETEHPKIGAWVNKLIEVVGTPDENTYFVGHSMGCQTILRYLQTLTEGTKIGGAVLVAGFVKLTEEAYETEEDRAIAKPWLETPINWDKIKQHKFVAIFSDNDPSVEVSNGDVFKEKLGAKIIVEKEKGHFAGDDKVFELPVALDELLKMSKDSA